MQSLQLIKWEINFTRDKLTRLVIMALNLQKKKEIDLKRAANKHLFSTLKLSRTKLIKTQNDTKKRNSLIAYS